MSGIMILPEETIELFVKKCFYNNSTLHTLNLVCKSITKIFDRYADKCTNGTLTCKECFTKKRRGIKGFCIQCLAYRMDDAECDKCGLEFISSCRGRNIFCLKCMPKRLRIKETYPKMKQFFRSDEPFCY